MVNISNIQHFSTGDGEGIRTTVFFKGCNLRCPWCHNPENLSAAPVKLCYKALGKTEILGKRVSVSEILPEILEDKDFYLQSGGGVTLSGGEVMLQAKEACELVCALRKEGIDVLMDTAGCVDYAYFEMLNPVVSGYLFDFKTADSEAYRAIGGDLALVSENLKRLLEEGIPVQVRIPLIPGFNTGEDEIRAVCGHLKTLGIKEVELLPFHRLGSAKYEAMGLDYEYKDQPPISREEMGRIKEQYLQHFHVIMER